jgi:hypothetical protein
VRQAGIYIESKRENGINTKGKVRPGGKGNPMLLIIATKLRWILF